MENTIEAKDLSVGNYVSVKNSGNLLFEVEETKREVVVLKELKTNQKLQFTYNSITPITISTIWLEDFHFVYEEWKTYSYKYPSHNGKIEIGYVWKHPDAEMFNNMYAFITEPMGTRVLFFGSRCADDKLEGWRFDTIDMANNHVHLLQNVFNVIESFQFRLKDNSRLDRKDILA